MAILLILFMRCLLKKITSVITVCAISLISGLMVSSVAHAGGCPAAPPGLCLTGASVTITDNKDGKPPTEVWNCTYGACPADGDKPPTKIINANTE